ncbi:sugar ABC transporter permease [Neobacillus sp. PS2-9]|uniref:carbohydrate ABC transporter permease n=1 Tax=Neobacillus sp. PS2-9 TaxID=3070676 RepID=UPI0027E19A7C|nr:sugar ABC transporter permease [Neobacillus sp. PS2-9]WML58637.1 sugar ABC transporter permease [Neobacillus sp. PS2-9]
MKKNRPFYYLFPSFFVILGVIFIPLLYALFISFIDLTKNVRKLDNPDLWNFVGFENYKNVLTSSEFFPSLWKTFYFTITSVGFEFVIGLAIALILNEQFKGRGIVRGLMLIPWAFPTIVNAVLWKWLYDADHGTITGLFAKLGLTEGYANVFASSFSAMNAIIVADVWKNTAFISLILLAALQSLPKSVYEAANVDGANVFRRFFKITLPLLSPAIMVALVMRTMEAFKVFDIIYIMTGGGPAGGTRTLSFLTYESSMMFSKFSYGSSIALMMSVFIMIFALIYIKILYRNVE